MKTTQGKAVAAYSALSAMARRPMNSGTAYKLFKLKKALSPVLEFQSEQEIQLVEEMGGTISDTGAILIADRDRRSEYQKRHRELTDLECDVDISETVIKMNELAEISVADMEALDDFIEWKE